MIERPSLTRDERLLDAPLTLTRWVAGFVLASAACAGLFWLLLSYPAFIFVAPLVYVGVASVARRTRGAIRRAGP